MSLTRGENDTFERKGPPLLDLLLPLVKGGNVLDELAKQLSAFANAGGGRIVYGITNTSTVDNGGITRSAKGRDKSVWRFGAWRHSNPLRDSRHFISLDPLHPAVSCKISKVGSSSSSRAYFKYCETASSVRPTCARLLGPCPSFEAPVHEFHRPREQTWEALVPGHFGKRRRTSNSDISIFISSRMSRDSWISGLRIRGRSSG